MKILLYYYLFHKWIYDKALKYIPSTVIYTYLYRDIQADAIISSLPMKNHSAGSWSQSSDSQPLDQRSQEEQHPDDSRLKGSESKAGSSTTAADSSGAVIEEEMEKMLGELSSEERQMLEEENAHLYKELMSNQEEVRQITRQVSGEGRMSEFKAAALEIYSLGFTV